MVVRNPNSNTFCFICYSVVLFVMGYNLYIFHSCQSHQHPVLLDFALTVKAATLIFISGRGSAISSAKEGKSGFIYNLVRSY